MQFKGFLIMSLFRNVVSIVCMHVYSNVCIDIYIYAHAGLDVYMYHIM